MSSKPGTPVTFTDGFVKNKDWIVIAAEIIAYAEAGYEHARCFTLKNGQWSHFDLDMVVRAVCGVQPPGVGTYFLGRDGRVRSIRAGVSHNDKIPDAGIGKGGLGYVHRIREIDGELYVCGVAGQIYRHEEHGWRHFDKGVQVPKSPTLFCIDGCSRKDIYAVGQRGVIWHHDGTSWTKLSSPTGRNLNWVRCSSTKEIYLCGDKGTFFKGSMGQWEDFSVPGLKEDFWCAEVFQGKVYLAADSELYVFDGKKVNPVDTGLDPIPDGHRLHANDGVLWSFGSEQLACYDGKKWTLVKHPDNP